jgi:hypothetical protein
MAGGWKRYANIRMTATASSIGALLMVWAVLVNRDQAAQSAAPAEAVAAAPAGNVAALTAASPTPAPAATTGVSRAQATAPRPRLRACAYGRFGQTRTGYDLPLGKRRTGGLRCRMTWPYGR